MSTMEQSMILSSGVEHHWALVFQTIMSFDANDAAPNNDMMARIINRDVADGYDMITVVIILMIMMI